jgi:hypothetical protein
MAHARITHATQKSTTSRRTREARRLFFKADHPRAIDQHIDYFGGAGGASAAAGDDLCGETLLERLA